MKQASRVLLWCAALVLTASGCDDAGVGTSGVPGVYTLRSVGERPLPSTIYTQGELSVAVASADMTLLDDSTFVDARAYLIHDGGDTPDTAADTAVGTFSLSGDKINFRTQDGDAYQMVWLGDKLTYYGEGFTFRYQK